ncbi:ABC transporter G family member 22 [Vitis vinifera]|uniref:ABC transporter G family member 22 n=1 Tax=Vitis vinifera TaxID=29760 RepID=A0A438CKE2_VITVI|nr:ABC transporter G family member 22 [Vitis vinifera]
MYMDVCPNTCTKRSAAWKALQLSTFATHKNTSTSPLFIPSSFFLPVWFASFFAVSEDGETEFVVRNNEDEVGPTGGDGRSGGGCDEIPDVGEATGGAESGGTLSRKSSRRSMMSASPGRAGGNSKNTHIRKSRSAQIKLDLDEVSSGAALSRASSASLGFSFSFTGFTVPPDESLILSRSVMMILLDDLEAGMRKQRIQAEPTLPIYLKFKDVTYKVILKGMRTNVEKEILNGITGSVNPGEVLALMGPSGSGKTTLLNLLGGRIGFVTQDDVLFPHLTVRETLTYAARLRLPKTLTKQQKEKRAVDVIYELGLDRCQDTMIGGSFVRGVSGGERKRVSIGNEIIINPSLLFLDEPTSGLDSTTALRIVQMLHDIAEITHSFIDVKGNNFNEQDPLYLTDLLGNLLYFGKASGTMEYFSSIGCSPLITMNPAEFLLDLANGNLNDVSIPSELEDKYKQSIQKLKQGMESHHLQMCMRQPNYKGNSKTTLVKLDLARKSNMNGTLWRPMRHGVADQEKKKLMIPIPIDEELKSKVCSPKREWGASWWEQYSILFRRGLKERRHDYFSWLRVTQVASTATILGLLWWQSESTNPKGLQDQRFCSNTTTGRAAFLYCCVLGLLSVFTAIFTFPQERAMLSKERAADMPENGCWFFFPNHAHSFPLHCSGSGTWASYWSHTNGLKEGNNFGFSNCDDLHVGWWIFVKKVPIFISWIRYISFNYHTYKLLLKTLSIHLFAEDETPHWSISNKGLKEHKAGQISFHFSLL